jgi:glutamate/tyrosine decarboxylase-like PLP-dependent enzyme
MRQLLETTAQRAITYLEGLDQRSVAPSPDAIAGLKALDEPLPEHPAAPGDVIALLDRVVSPATMAMAGPRFFGFVIGGSQPVTLATNWLVQAWDQNSALANVTPATARVEAVALRWLLDLLGLPATAAGAFVTGGTMANFACLAAARHAVLARAGWNVEADGLIGGPPVQVIVGNEAHPTLFKSLGLLGLGRNRVARVPVDGQGRMRADALPEITTPTIICTQAGNLNTGAFDPIGGIAELVADTGAWVHVDGAIGLWAAGVPSLQHLVPGLAKADSWSTDAHKWLNVPKDSGLAFVKDGAALRAAMAITAEYLPSVSADRNPADYTPELSRRARGVEVWAALRCLGRAGFEAMIAGCVGHARRFAEGLRAAGFEILNDVQLNQVLVSFGDADTTTRVIAAVQQDGTCWCGPTVWQGRTAMRISVSSWATTTADVDKSLEAIVRTARSMPSAKP